MAAYTLYVTLTIQRGDGVAGIGAAGVLVDSNGAAVGSLSVVAPFDLGDDYATRLANVETAVGAAMDPDTATVVVISDPST